MALPSTPRSTTIASTLGAASTVTDTLATAGADVGVVVDVAGAAGVGPPPPPPPQAARRKETVSAASHCGRWLRAAVMESGADRSPREVWLATMLGPRTR